MIIITGEFVEGMDGNKQVFKTVTNLLETGDHPMTVGDGLDQLIASMHTSSDMEELLRHADYVIGQMQIYRNNLTNITSNVKHNDRYL